MLAVVVSVVMAVICHETGIGRLHERLEWRTWTQDDFHPVPTPLGSWLVVCPPTKMKRRKRKGGGGGGGRVIYQEAKRARRAGFEARADDVFS